MSRIECKYVAGLFEIFILLHISLNCVCLGDFFTNEDTVMLIIRNLNLVSVQSWTLYLQLVTTKSRFRVINNMLRNSGWPAIRCTVPALPWRNLKTEEPPVKETIKLDPWLIHMTSSFRKVLISKFFLATFNLKSL